MTPEELNAKISELQAQYRDRGEIPPPNYILQQRVESGEADPSVPEGVYTVTDAQVAPNSETN